MEYKTLSGGHKIASIGFGTYLIPKNETINAVYNAIKEGYRHIDTAAAYENEEGNPNFYLINKSFNEGIEPFDSNGADYFWIFTLSHAAPVVDSVFELMCDGFFSSADAGGTSRNLARPAIVLSADANFIEGKGTLLEPYKVQ